MDEDLWPPVPKAASQDGGPSRGPRALTPAIAASIVLLVASAAAAISFVAATGGLQLPGTLPTDAAVTIGSPAPPTATPAPTAAVTPSPAPGPTATPAPSPAASPTVSVTPAPTSDRYQLLEQCPTTPDCYLYTIRIGDNLRSIANYFGVRYDTILLLNPTITEPETILPGDVIVLPQPGR